jgi:sugar phosphate isomerase/epimerase
MDFSPTAPGNGLRAKENGKISRHFFSFGRKVGQFRQKAEKAGGKMKIMKFVPALALALMLSGCCSPWCRCPESAPEPNISVFAHFIRNTAKEQGISLVEAADKLYDLGVRGFDVGPDDKDLAELASSKLKPINFYFFPRMFDAGTCAEDCKRCLDQAVKYGVPRVMVVPTHFTKGGDEAAEFEKDMSGMKLFVAEAKKRGITITVEDFGGPMNPGSHMKYLKRMLDEIPDLKFALDSGNLYYAGRGEDILDMMAYAKGRIAHVHLKDQTRENNRKYATLGLGAVPNEKIVKEMARSGYKGWYTLENTVGNVYTDAIRQVAVLKYWLSEAGAK